MSRAVVTGAAGFIGSHTSHALLEAGWEVVGIDAFTDFYPEAEKRANLAALSTHPRFHLVEGHLLHVDLDDTLAGADAVVHLAAQAGVTGSWGSAFATYVEHNLLATQRLLEAADRARVPRLVAASSSSVYGNAPAYPCTEASPTRPVSPYGVTKLAAEQLCLAYARAHVTRFALVLLRFFTVYGPAQRPDMALRRFVEAALDGRSIVVYGDGEQTRDFTYVGDAVRAVLLALEAPLAAEVLNIGGGFRASINHTLRLVAELTAMSVTLDRRAERPGEVRHTGADCDRARQLLGWRPEVDLAAGLAAQVAWCASRRGTQLGETGPAPAAARQARIDVP